MVARTMWYILFMLSCVCVFSTAGRTILDEVDCGEIRTFCSNLSENDDILILECLQSLPIAHLSHVTQKCQHTIWNHVKNLTENGSVKSRLGKVCGADLPKLKPCENNDEYLKCVVNNKDVIVEEQCTNLVVRLENVAFQDYRFIQKFLEHCNADIDRLRCGRIDAQRLDQSSTIACLQDNIATIQNECQKEVFKLSEIQADNIRLDSQLYLACMEDHRRFCQQFPAGSGRVFNCLIEQAPDTISTRCRTQLLRRQKLLAQDYRISKGLMRACREDIKKSHCRRQASNDKAIRLAQILLCLENVMKNGTRVEPECQAEMVEHRRILMEDFRLSPEIVDGCGDEIRKYCAGLDVGGKTIHCLMDHARMRNVHKRIGEVCQRALESLVKQADIGEDWRVDPVLYKNCAPVAQTLCRSVIADNPRTMSCLMDNVGAEQMTEECEDTLVQIQYFMARDFKLDPQLYRACKSDAMTICRADPDWIEKRPSNDPQVLPCLYRHMVLDNDDKVKVKKACALHIRRVMRQRAISVDLQPEVAEACLDDLASFCTERTRKGEEMLCLQQNLEELTDKCHDVIRTYTEAQAEHVDLNPYIMQNCRRELESVCGEEFKNEPGSVMDCLIKHKNEVTIKSNPACRTSIEHFQIISLKDYRFSYKFKTACKTFALNHCSAAKSGTDVVACLSEKVLKDTMDGVKSTVPKECRQQLKAQLLQQHENIDFNAKLTAACKDDIKEHCNDIEHGSGRVLECLQSMHRKLRPQCEDELFKLKKLESDDNSVDYALMNICAESIEQFCPHHETATVLECLKSRKDEIGFGKKCRQIVLHRMYEQNTNYQLNPGLQDRCKPDIMKYCSDIVHSKQPKDLNGAVLKCLKNSFKKGALTSRCQKEMVEILREQALDAANLNPLLNVLCENELKTICKFEGDESGDTTECLKKALLEKKIPTPECRNEVANLIQESQADIQVDPKLQQICALDLLNYCKDVPQGNGRHVKCLKMNMNHLTNDCKSMLSARLKIYESFAEVIPPQDMQALYQQVVISPVKHYVFLTVLMILGAIFVIGIFLGRSTKRHMLIKNK